MSLIATGASLTQRCSIERDASSATDDGWGNPNVPNWQPHLSDVRCFAWAESGQEVIEGSATVEPVQTVHLLLPADTDVTERDRVATVTYRGGTAQDGPLAVRALLRRPDHIELVLVKT